MSKSVATATKPAFGSKGSSLLDKYSFDSYEKNPYELPYKDLLVGEKYVLRVLTLSTEETRVLFNKRVELYINKEKYTGWINAYVPFALTWKGDASTEQEYVVGKDGKPLHYAENVLANLYDHKGNNVLEAKTSRFYRIPVWVYEKVDGKGRREEIGKLMYMEINEFMKNTLIQLPKQQDGAFEFNQYGLPDYDIEIRAIKGQNGMKNYEVDGIMGSPRNPHPNYGVPTEKALADYISIINEEWDILQENMNDFMNLEAIERKLKKPESNTSSLSSKPMLTETQQEIANQHENENHGEPDGSEQEVPEFRFGR